MGRSHRQKDVVITPDGWVVFELKSFQFLTDHSPPRPGVIRRQIITDAKDWKVIAFLGVGFGLIILAVTRKEWQLGVIGLLVLSAWFRMFRQILRTVRDSPLLVGVIATLLPHYHPFVANYSRATARLREGGEVEVYLPHALLTSQASEIIEVSKQAEVLFLLDPVGYGLVIGVRALPKHIA